MAQDDVQQDDRTEEASPERREEFREKGQVVVSKEFTSVAILAASVAFISAFAIRGFTSFEKMLVSQLETLSTRRINESNILKYAGEMWVFMLYLVIPVFAVTAIFAVASTFAQTRMNFAWKKLEPDWNRMNPLSGIARMVNTQAAMELVKGVAKMTAVGIVAWLILRGEVNRVPELMNYPIVGIWGYWGDITKSLHWAVAALLLVVASGDYLYNFISFERRIKMTKQEVKEEYKRREVDPHVKGKLRRMARDFATKKALEATKDATVLITNPTHYSIALKYELGMDAPILVAKGIDHLALKMREVAKDQKIPIIENRPLARELYATVDEGQEIPHKLYKVVSEIIKYVFQLKGRRIPRKTPSTQAPVPPQA
jgi:flagellar biosynthetic protein FlhB